MINFKTLKAEVNGQLGTLLLNRPDRGNALSETMLRELIDAANWFNAQADVRVVILRGAGKHFCAGADIKEPPLANALPESGLSWTQRRELAQLGKRMIDAVENMRAITIAEVHGAAIGGGLLLMMACDFRFVQSDTVMSIPEVDLGIPLAWGGIPRLVREIGPARSKELVMSCRNISPEEFFQMGVVNRVCEAESLRRDAGSFANSLLAKPSVPLVITKEHVNAAAQELASTSASFSDGDALLAVARDPEAAASLARYLKQLKGSIEN